MCVCEVCVRAVSARRLPKPASHYQYPQFDLIVIISPPAERNHHDLAFIPPWWSSWDSETLGVDIAPGIINPWIERTAISKAFIQGRSRHDQGGQATAATLAAGLSKPSSSWTPIRSGLGVLLYPIRAVPSAHSGARSLLHLHLYDYAHVVNGRRAKSR